jgi:hypothetical protein
MADNSNAFVKGGCGCVLAFLVVSFLSVLVGGRVRINLCGVAFVFVIGGLISQALLWVYNKGKENDGGGGKDGGEPDLFSIQDQLPLEEGPDTGEDEVSPALSNALVVTLEDDEPRRTAMSQALESAMPETEYLFFDNAPDMIEWLERHLRSVDLICLDHDLGPNIEREGEFFDPGTGREVADFLAGREPSCPVIIHSSNAPAVEGMKFALEDAGWKTQRVVPFDNLDWIGGEWIEAVVRCLGQRA